VARTRSSRSSAIVAGGAGDQEFARVAEAVRAGAGAVGRPERQRRALQEEDPAARGLNVPPRRPTALVL